MVRVPDVAPPNAVPRVTLLPLVSSVVAVAATIVRRLEMSCVLPVAHCSVPPFTVMLPAEPSALAANESVPALTVVPPV